jgi:hypothetical protein
MNCGWKGLWALLVDDDNVCLRFCVSYCKFGKCMCVSCVQGLLEEGNRRRKTDSTDANAASSRSHAVSRSCVRSFL